jgi:hypothetical protein
MAKKKIAAANTESPQVAEQLVAQDVAMDQLIAQDRDLIDIPTETLYYEYTTPDGVSVLLDRYEWSRGLGITDKAVKKAQAARHREVAKGFAIVEEA